MKHSLDNVTKSFYFTYILIVYILLELYISWNKIGLHLLYVHPVHLTEFKDKTTCN